MSSSLIDRLPLPSFLKPAAEPKHYGVMADFDSPEDLLRAIRTLRTAGFTRMEAYTPFPIHGIDDAMGEPRSPLGRIVICGAVAGILAAIALQWWTGAVDYPLVIAGKPLFAIEPSVPIIFELAVLLSAFSAVFGMLALNKLPQYYHPAFNFSRYAGATNDRFLLAVESTDPKFQPEELTRLLESLGSRHTELVAA
jgi:hypothetical protein